MIALKYPVIGIAKIWKSGEVYRYNGLLCGVGVEWVSLSIE